MFFAGKREGGTTGGGGHRPFPIGPNRRCVANCQARQNPLRIAPGMARGEGMKEGERGVCFAGCVVDRLVGWLVGWLVRLWVGGWFVCWLFRWLSVHFRPFVVCPVSN